MRMNVHVLAVLTLGGCLLQSSTAQTPVQISPETRSAMEHIAGSILVGGHAYNYDEQLADNIGGRLTGSDAYNKGVAWGVEQFKALGLKNVHTEAWTIPDAWEPETLATAEMVEPRYQRLHLESLGWSPSTPEGGVKGQVVYVKDVLHESALRVQAAEIKGNIVLIDRGSLHADGPLPIGVLLHNLNLLGSLGAQALILGFGPPNNLIGQKGIEADGSLTSLPTAGLGNEDTLLIRRLMKQGPVTISFSFRNRIRKNVQVENVVAELPGRDNPGEWLLIGGHLDSWHPGTGAQDNGTGVASVIETARAIIASGRPPRRTLRFVLFGGEEEGLLGSQAYEKAHASGLIHCDAVVITDIGAGAPKGWYTFGREDIKQALSSVEPLLAGLGASGTNDDNDNFFDSDHAPFLVQGIPVLFLWPDLTKYFDLHHLPADTFDKVDERNLNEGTAVVALTAYAIADSPTPFAPHLNQQQMESILKDEKVYEQYLDMKKHSIL